MTSFLIWGLGKGHAGLPALSERHAPCHLGWTSHLYGRISLVSRHSLIS